LVHPIPWYIALVESVPETFLLLSLSLRLFNIKITVKQLLLISFLTAFVGYLARLLPVFFGLHTIVMLVFGTLLLYAFSQVPLLKGFICVMTGALLTGVTQFLTLPILFNTLSIDLDITKTNPWWNFGLFIPSAVLMILLYIIVVKFDFVLYDLSENIRNENLE